MPDGMDYALVERTVLDGLGKIFDTTPGSPDTGSYVTEATLLAWIKGKTLVPGYLYNGVWYSDSGHTTPVTGEAGSLYVEQEEDVLYRWDGEAFSPMSDAQLREDILDGTVTAKKAECDASGNVITTTYAKQAEVDNHEARIENLEEAHGSYHEVDVKSVYTIPSGKGKNWLVDKLRGVSRVKNQIARGAYSRTVAGLVITYNSTTKKITITGTASDTGNYTFFSQGQSDFVAGHKYLVFTDCKSSLKLSNNDIGVDFVGSTLLDFSQRTVFIGINAVSGQTYNEDFFVCITDLNVYFNGSIPTDADTIAEIQTNYPWLLTPSDYGTSAVETVYEGVRSKARNLWDEVWEAGGFWSSGQNNDSYNSIRAKNYIDVTPNTVCYLTYQPQYVFFYDGDNNIIGYATTQQFTTPPNCKKVRFSTSNAYGQTYHNNICLNVSDSLNGTYTPYKPPVTLTFPTPVSLKSAGAVAEEYYPCVEVNGEYKSKTTHPVETLIFDGSDDENWVSSIGGRFYIALHTLAKLQSYVGNIFACPLFTVANNVDMENVDYCVSGYKDSGSSPSYPNQNWLYVRLTSSTTLAQLKAWLADNPLEVTYTLATPSPDTYVDPILNNMIATEPGGTIESVLTNPVDDSMTLGYINL